MFLLLMTAALGQEPATMAERLAELRAEVEALSEELSHRQSDTRADLRTKEQARAELELRIREEQARIESLERALERHQETLQAESESSEVLVPVLHDAARQLIDGIESGPPYRVTERKQAVQEILQQLAEHELSPERAAHRLWQVAEDELRLTRENSLDKQIIQLDGTDRLVSLARLGMVALYFRTPEGELGYWSGSDWTRIHDMARGAQVEELFDALKKQVRVGWFELPNPRG